MKVRRNRVSRGVPIEAPTQRSELRPEDKLEDASPDSEEICAKGEQEAALRDAVAKLRPTLREAVELY
jgi:DNA-directed RNA polymerase specialized sigma24 family protein